MGQILYCHCSNARVLSQPVRDNVLKKLCEDNLSFIAVSDFCGQCVYPNGILEAYDTQTDGLIIACYPRALKSLFKRLKKDLPASVKTANLRIQNLKDAFDLITEFQSSAKAGKSSDITASSSIRVKIKNNDKFDFIRCLLDEGFSVYVCSVGDGEYSEILVEAENWAGNGVNPQSAAFRKITTVDSKETLLSLVKEAFPKSGTEKWYPWFPVVDYNLCSGCMQCLSFCLFGVYDVDDDGKLAAVSPDKCKTNCPACARVCPDGAIIFPKYSSEPINGGEIRRDLSSPATQKVDIHTLINGDIYEKLRQRSSGKTRFAPANPAENQQLAEKERQYYTQKFAQDIPPEVLKSLPPRDELKRLAEEAAKRAQNALDMKNKKEK